MVTSACSHGKSKRSYIPAISSSYDHERFVGQRRKSITSRRERGAIAVAFTGNGGGAAAEAADLSLIGPYGYAAIVQEVHQVMAHIVCDLVEQRLIFDDGIA